MSMSRAFSNPLAEDPTLKELLDDITKIPDELRFKRWRDEFLKEFDKYLDPQGSRNADAAYREFSRAVLLLAKDVRRMEIFRDKGEMNEGRCSVQALKCLGNFYAKILKTTDMMGKLMPPTQEAERKVGFTKFNLGAVLVRDGFVEYDRLEKIKIHLKGLRERGLEKVADKTVLQAIDRYGTVFEQLLDILADLGLYQVMEQCSSFIKGEWAPMSPKRSPTKSPVKIRIADDTSFIKEGLLKIPDLDRETFSQETAPESSSPSNSYSSGDKGRARGVDDDPSSDSDSDSENDSTSDKDSKQAHNTTDDSSSSSSSRGKPSPPRITKKRSIFAPKPTDPSERVYRRSKSVVRAEDWEHTAMKKSSGNTFEFTINGLDEWKGVKSDPVGDVKATSKARSKSVGAPLRRNEPTVHSEGRAGGEDRTQKPQRRVKPITPEELKQERQAKLAVFSPKKPSKPTLHTPMMRLHGPDGSETEEDLIQPTIMRKNPSDETALPTSDAKMPFQAANESDETSFPGLLETKQTNGGAASPRSNTATMKLRRPDERDESDPGILEPTMKLRGSRDDHENGQGATARHPASTGTPDEDGSYVSLSGHDKQAQQQEDASNRDAPNRLPNMPQYSKTAPEIIEPRMKLRPSQEHGSDALHGTPKAKSRSHGDPKQAPQRVENGTRPTPWSKLKQSAAATAHSPGNSPSRDSRPSIGRLQGPEDDSASLDGIRQPTMKLQRSEADNPNSDRNRPTMRIDPSFSDPNHPDGRGVRYPREPTRPNENPSSRAPKSAERGRTRNHNAADEDSPRTRSRSIGRQAVGQNKRSHSPTASPRGRSRSVGPVNRHPASPDNGDPKKQGLLQRLAAPLLRDRAKSTGRNVPESRHSKYPEREQNNQERLGKSRPSSAETGEPGRLPRRSNTPFQKRPQDSRDTRDDASHRATNNRSQNSRPDPGDRQASKRSSTPFRKEPNHNDSKQPRRMSTPHGGPQDDSPANQKQIRRSNSSASDAASQQRNPPPTQLSRFDSDTVARNTNNVPKGPGRLAIPSSRDDESQKSGKSNSLPRSVHARNPSSRDDDSSSLQSRRSKQGSTASSREDETLPPRGKATGQSRPADRSKPPGKLSIPSYPKNSGPGQSRNHATAPRSRDNSSPMPHDSNDAVGSARDPRNSTGAGVTPTPGRLGPPANNNDGTRADNNVGRLDRPDDNPLSPRSSSTPFRKRHQDDEAPRDSKRSSTPFRKQPPNERPDERRSNTPFRRHGDNAAPDARRSSTPFRKPNADGLPNDKQLPTQDQPSRARSNTPFRRPDAETPSSQRSNAVPPSQRGATADPRHNLPDGAPAAASRGETPSAVRGNNPENGSTNRRPVDHPSRAAQQGSPHKPPTQRNDPPGDGMPSSLGSGHPSNDMRNDGDPANGNPNRVNDKSAPAAAPNKLKNLPQKNAPVVPQDARTSKLSRQPNAGAPSNPGASSDPNRRPGRGQGPSKPDPNRNNPPSRSQLPHAATAPEKAPGVNGNEPNASRQNSLRRNDSRQGQDRAPSNQPRRDGPTDPNANARDKGHPRGTPLDDDNQPNSTRNNKSQPSAAPPSSRNNQARPNQRQGPPPSSSPAAAPAAAPGKTPPPPNQRQGPPSSSSPEKAGPGKAPPPPQQRQGPPVSNNHMPKSKSSPPLEDPRDQGQNPETSRSNSARPDGARSEPPSGNGNGTPKKPASSAPANGQPRSQKPNERKGQPPSGNGNGTPKPASSAPANGQPRSQKPNERKGQPPPSNGGGVPKPESSAPTDGQPRSQKPSERKGQLSPSNGGGVPKPQSSAPDKGQPQQQQQQQQQQQNHSKKNMPDRKEPKGQPDKDGYCPCCGQKWPVWKRWFGWGP